MMEGRNDQISSGMIKPKGARPVLWCRKYGGWLETGIKMCQGVK